MARANGWQQSVAMNCLGVPGGLIVVPVVRSVIPPRLLMFG